MMFQTVDLLLVGFVLTGIMIKPSKCQPNSTIQPNEPKCLTYLDEVVQILGSKIPPIIDSRMTDNYYNISRALYPSIDLPALYVKVTIQFLKDYQNGTKIIDGDTMKLTWSTSCTYVSVKHISLFAMTVFSLATIYPQRRETELTITVLPLCKDSPYKHDDEARTKMWRYIVSTFSVFRMLLLPL
ncbi:uncharacterized protein LOC116292809 [Actinia tenebrosa]|uniref:Uncharacterized protein LOC116292809 n=1 Tax=Actinia tenebrosa TaxID=6105 RepID=A0A6P8HTS6_ACTTE|nr:uncharacterized protein LOC116292809 [Actinia tenebrosa]